MKVSDPKIYVALLVGAGLSAGGVTALNTDDILYSGSASAIIGDAAISKIDAIVDKSLPGFVWNSVTCQRDVGTVDHQQALVTRCSAQGLGPGAETSVDLDLSRAVVENIDWKASKAAPGLIWTSVDCVRSPGIVDGNAQLVTVCSFFGDGKASSMAELPDGAQITKVE